MDFHNRQRGRTRLRAEELPDARSDYQIAGLLGYQISRRWNLLGGYRYLGIDYRPYGNKQFILDMNVPGVMVGATFTIK
ncbi:MAG: hypothetical protein WBQ89_16755 [Candidatus Acidiferrum sp.]